MARNRIEDMRDLLFGILEDLRDTDEPLTDEMKDRAKLACDVSGRIIESGKLEVDFMKVLAATDDRERTGSGFIPAGPRDRLLGEGDTPS